MCRLIQNRGKLVCHKFNSYCISSLLSLGFLCITLGCYSTIWVPSWENLFLPYANDKGADQPAHPHSLISAFVVHCLDSIIPLLAIAENSRPKPVSVAEQTNLSLTSSPIPKTGFLVMWLILSLLLYDLITVSLRTVLVPIGFDCITTPGQLVL